MDKIFFKNLCVHGLLGVDSWEREKKQPIVVSIEAFVDISLTSSCDNLLTSSVNYGTLSKTVASFVETNRYRSIEGLASAIAEHCLDVFTIQMIHVTIEKPRALLHSKCAGVSLFRSNTTKELSPDTLFITELSLSTIIGMNSWERNEKQRVVVDLTLYPTTWEPSQDHVSTYNYRTIARTVSEYIEQSTFKTVEALVSAVAKICNDVCKVPKVKVCAAKPSAIVFADSAGVEIVRERHVEIKSIHEHSVIIALGSNLENRVDNIHRAIDLLIGNNFTLIDTSFLYESDPMYVVDQPQFLNAVVKVVTKLAPEEVLKKCKWIESELHRAATFRNGPRTVDLDILFYDTIVYSSDSLIIPHPMLHEREFVLRPLCDIAAEIEHPTQFRMARQLLKLLELKDDFVTSLCKVTPCGNTLLQLGKTTLLMGILNVTPDSFSDGGLFSGVDDALKRAREMVEEGADIIDIGGMSTRPNSEPISQEIELQRVLPVINAIRDSGLALPLSIDTYRSEVARQAVLAGCNIINDVSGGRRDPSILQVASELKVPICLMHMRGDSKTMSSHTDYKGDVIGGIRKELSECVGLAINCGIHRWNIIADPGIGFAKNSSQNFEIVRHLQKITLGKLRGFPLLVGPSRKKFIGDATNQDNPADRKWGTASVVAACIQSGAEILRVHDVKEMKDVVKVSDCLWR